MPPISEDDSTGKQMMDASTTVESIVGDQINDMLDEALDISPQVMILAT